MQCIARVKNVFDWDSLLVLLKAKGEDVIFYKSYVGLLEQIIKLIIWTLVIPFTPLFQCIWDETPKTVGPFYLVSMPGEVKDPTNLHWQCVTCRGPHHS